MESTTEKPIVTGIYGTGKPLFVFNIISMIILWVVFGMRVYVRLVMVKIWSATDWHMLITLLLYTWLCVSANIFVWDGFGRDMNTLPGVQLVSAFRAYYFGEMSYVASVLFVKLSLCYFYLPLTNLRWQIYTVYALVVINSVYTTAYLCVIIFQCSPVDYFWNQFLNASGGRCLNTTVIMNLSYCHNTMEILSDWILSVMPIWLLKGTQLPTRTKIAVSVLLSLGAFASIASIIRITQLTSFASSTNYTVTSIPIILWSIIENAVGIMAANLATLRLLLASILQRLGLTSLGSGGSGALSGPSGPSNTRSRHLHTTGRGGGGTKKGGPGGDWHDLPSLKRENSSSASYKSTERMVGRGLGAGNITTTVISKSPAYGEDNSSAEELSPMGISKNTEVTVTSEQRKE
ncbi:putative integral membrane protein [Neofusicoccum parvum]|uniref:Integral membrane protein n=1 Tax=Neofusicoccum parvum TaxID=310453 RepID=A0ACB5S9Y6_9PEZI|nr:putative integral membrane protein [Neofusicoccum parvum]